MYPFLWLSESIKKVIDTVEHKSLGRHPVILSP